MNRSQGYPCPLHPESPSHLPSHPLPPGVTGFGCLESYIKLTLIICFTHGNVYVSMLPSIVTNILNPSSPDYRFVDTAPQPQLRNQKKNLKIIQFFTVLIFQFYLCLQSYSGITFTEILFLTIGIFYVKSFKQKNGLPTFQTLLSINLIRIELLFNVVLVSAVQQCESAICIRIFPPSRASLPATTIPPLETITSTELSSLCYIQLLPTSSLFHTWSCPYATLICESNATLSICPAVPFPSGIRKTVCYICVSIPALQIGSLVPFFQIPYICVQVQYLFFSF